MSVTPLMRLSSSLLPRQVTPRRIPVPPELSDAVPSIWWRVRPLAMPIAPPLSRSTGSRPGRMTISSENTTVWFAVSWKVVAGLRATRGSPALRTTGAAARAAAELHVHAEAPAQPLFAVGFEIDRAQVDDRQHAVGIANVSVGKGESYRGARFGQRRHEISAIGVGIFGIELKIEPGHQPQQAIQTANLGFLRQ